MPTQPRVQAMPKQVEASFAKLQDLFDGADYPGEMAADYLKEVCAVPIAYHHILLDHDSMRSDLTELLDRVSSLEPGAYLYHNIEPDALHTSMELLACPFPEEELLAKIGQAIEQFDLSPDL